MNKTKSIELIRKEKEELYQVAKYCKNMRSFIFKARYTNETLKETEEFIQAKFPNQTGCIYCSSRELRSPHNTIPFGAPISVLEMNEDTSEIVAIGFVINKPRMQKYAIHAENYKNTFNYIGKYRITREGMNEEEECIMQVFEAICFNGIFHLKHGLELNMFSPKLLWRAGRIVDLVAFVENMFRKRMCKNINIYENRTCDTL
jgi:hypothetical protein